MKVAIACDHGGFELKQEILSLLKDMNVEYEDFGSYDDCAIATFMKNAPLFCKIILSFLL